MSEERCEKGVFVNGPTPNAPWCTEHDQPWEECYEYLRALLAEERRRRKEVEKKLVQYICLVEMIKQHEIDADHPALSPSLDGKDVTYCPCVADTITSINKKGAEP